MPKAAEEMRQWAALLERELLSWPAVRAKPMFGCVLFYRADTPFAALPRTRALGTPNSVNFKFTKMPDAWKRELERDERAQAETMGGTWKVFEVRSSDDLKDALRWLERAYRQAR